MDIWQRKPYQEIESEVLVVGGGSAGVTAAIAAAREGATTLLVERYGFLGGISTQVLDTFYGFYTPGSHPRKVVGGIPDEVVEALAQYNAMLIRPNTYGAGNGITYNPEILKIIWETLAIQARVKILFHALAVEVSVNQQRIETVIVATKSGVFRIRPCVIVDASGDADIAALAGVPYESAAHGPVQALTTTFRLLNVDIQRATQVSKKELHERMAQAIAEGAYDLPRREGSVHITPLPGVMATNMTRVVEVDPTDIEQLSHAEIEGRRQALEYFRFLRERVPGYEHAHLAGLSIQIGVRESRRIFGQYRLTREDVLTARKFEDAIAQCGAPIEEHHAGKDTRWEYLPEGETYHIPYRCLLPRNCEGLIVAGRCLSADHDAHASVRSMGQCMAMGQAAGIAAAWAAQHNTSPTEVPIFWLRERLCQIGAILD
ncbi:FAD-dependent oxidoreductase [uncultured Thermanaerothrix sp.]|uniref:FAD-dependent oxidoreductase n=1 Tax=uncultured Thermanaerothrix sp. TaxID=1195149 RepID=UPI00262A3EB3|nr:FAD-dependent oxidoreductase [uncultured Thermanaerothrix sp.]